MMEKRYTRSSHYSEKEEILFRISSLATFPALYNDNVIKLFSSNGTRIIPKFYRSRRFVLAHFARRRRWVGGSGEEETRGQEVPVCLLFICFYLR